MEEALFYYLHRMFHEWKAAYKAVHKLHHRIQLQFGRIDDYCTQSIANSQVMNAEMHDLHHERFNCNYGVLGILDYLHGIKPRDV
ncbi:hypothetical protein Pmar_PMAR001027 [Perkinsus marinus ATCC 50983]|uniref:Uncharacterized protein n=1 Tax=Perkinsus marinus (strain ATCC 50983 / TXsc) TaxID=423536 RepID=C5KTC5_PERM5|nr:hypothetical protein Pmar_PMAR001027 [Perkinsus marinus ATCC 50983]EER12230.1 hypothetical protein Pmar_PMAR001027 [Perkinsus marinus ATCC 50983]|eukprot:XP_002780435.1 hypothetical protein Pmar_PMAR001027 [Perkinsus marinus ATCC 50983]